MSVLQGKRVLITRPEGQAEGFAQKLKALGAEPVVLPAIELLPPEDWTPVDRALSALAEGSYDWVVFTSANGVRFALARLREVGLEMGIFGRTKLAAIGPATAQALRREGLEVAFMPQQFIAEAIAEGLDAQGQRVLLLRADIARGELHELLRAQGAHVEEVAVYRTRPARLALELLREVLQRVDVVTFTSSSTVHALMDALRDSRELLNGTIVACIGPITARAARRRGLPVHIEAEEHTIDGLIRALIGFFEKTKGRWRGDAPS